jgi:AcrR family transcriptional regulator
MSSISVVEKASVPPPKRARERILHAAEELARSEGAGNISLDAVAARARVSKGGLLYHFPTKAKLLEALVEQFLATLERELNHRERQGGGVANATARAYLDIMIDEQVCGQPPPSGLLAALAENPDFLEPVRRFDRQLLDRMKASASDPALAVLVFLVMQGIKSGQLLNVETIDAGEFDSVIARLRDMLGQTAAAPVDST